MFENLKIDMLVIGDNYRSVEPKVVHFLYFYCISVPILLSEKVVGGFFG